jgi:hypothetical protein
LSPRSARDSYEARVSIARELYRQVCKESADLPVFQRTSAEAAAFTALKSMQQDAMRESSRVNSQSCSICGRAFPRTDGFGKLTNL